MATSEEQAREVRDVYGRRRYLGASAEDLLGHGRSRQLLAAWLCLVAISPLQYAIGAAALYMPAGFPGPEHAMTVFAVFVVFQALTAIVVARVQGARTVPPSRLVTVGGVLAAVGLLSLTQASSSLAVVGGYAMCGGVGGGLVYAQCATTVGRWYPDRRPSALGLVTSGFALGAVPVIALLSLAGGGLDPAFGYAAVAALVIALVAGFELKDPPDGWWPPHIDPQAWAVDRRLNRGIGHNMPAVREFTPEEALRDGTLRVMWVMLVLTSAVSLFGIAFVAGYAVASDLGLGVAGLAAGLVAALNGLGRFLGGRLSDQYGRERIIVAVLLVEALGQLGLAGFGPTGGPVVFAICSMLVGLGGGAFYVMFAQLVLEYFGEDSVVQNQAVLYTAKALGGAIGIGAGAALVAGTGYRPGFLVAGLLGLVTAGAVRRLRQPGRPAVQSGSVRRI